MNGQDQGQPPPQGQPPQQGYPQQPGQPGPGYPGYPGQGAPQGSGPGFCPSCGSGQYRPETFTWWGGLVGPKLLNHVTCLGCGTGFNSKTGKSNSTAIAIYLVAGGVLAIVIFGFLMSSMF